MKRPRWTHRTTLPRSPTAARSWASRLMAQRRAAAVPASSAKSRLQACPCGRRRACRPPEAELAGNHHQIAGAHEGTSWPPVPASAGRCRVPKNSFRRRPCKARSCHVDPGNVVADEPSRRRAPNESCGGGRLRFYSGDADSILHHRPCFVLLTLRLVPLAPAAAAQPAKPIVQYGAASGGRRLPRLWESKAGTVPRRERARSHCWISVATPATLYPQLPPGHGAQTTTETAPAQSIRRPRPTRPATGCRCASRPMSLMEGVLPVRRRRRGCRAVQPDGLWCASRQPKSAGHRPGQPSSRPST